MKTVGDKFNLFHPKSFLIANERRQLVKFLYSEKATKFCEISTVDLTVTT